MSLKPQPTEHPPHPVPTPQLYQGIVISTSPTSPGPQVPNSFLRFPSDLWSCFWFSKCCLRKSSAVLVGWGRPWASWQTDFMDLLIKKERAQYGLSSLLEALRGSLPSNYLLLLSKDIKYLQKYEILETLLLYQIFLQSAHCSKRTSIRCDVQVENKIDSKSSRIQG